MATYPSWQDPNSTPYSVWRDKSKPSFTSNCPSGIHAAWYFTFENKDYGPYFTRQDAEKAAFILAVK